MKKLIAFAALIALLLSLGTVFAAAELPENVSFTPGKYLGGDPDAYSPVGEITVAWLPDVSDRVDMTDGDLSDWYALGLTATNIDAVIGSVGIVTADIDNVASSGQVKLNGMEWTARSTSDASIEAGTKIRVDKIEGVKVFVTPMEVKTTV